MDERLKKVTQWTIYILIVLIIIFTLVILLVLVIAPTFFPEKDVSGFKDYINTFCVLLSFLSAGLGLYSVFQATSSNKQAERMIQSIQELKYQQELLCVRLSPIDGERRVSASSHSEEGWVRDDINT